jgi:hypothetical protein
MLLKSFGQKPNSSIYTTLEFLVGAGGCRKPRISKGPAGAIWPPGHMAAADAVHNPPAYVSLTFVQKKTASVSVHKRFIHGRGVDYVKPRI